MLEGTVTALKRLEGCKTYKSQILHVISQACSSKGKTEPDDYFHSQNALQYPSK